MTSSSKKQKVGVFVLGPLDRSPRMLNHTISLAQATKFKVEFVGYRGTSMPQRLKEFREQIKILHISTDLVDKLKEMPRILYPLYAALRIIIQIWQLLSLMISANYDMLLLQNPPCVPLLFVVWLYKLYRGIFQGQQPHVIIDWHNYGYTIMEANGVRGPLVWLAKWHERSFGAIGDQHLTVSNAFKQDLVDNFGLPEGKVSVLYDRAVAGKFKVLSTEEKHRFFNSVNLENKFTVPSRHEIEYRDDRPLLLITSTSYTPDEDLSLLLKGLELYVKRAMVDQYLPKIHMIVTGNGPLKRQFLQKFDQFNEYLAHEQVYIEPKWLEIDEYPKMVASADLGICLHMSSSNFDLPMKIVDLYSCKVPCFAYDYPTIGELVQSECRGSKTPTGALFKTEKDLVALLTSHFGEGLEKGIEKLEGYRANLNQFVGETWDEHWKDVMLYQKGKGCLFGKQLATALKKEE